MNIRVLTRWSAALGIGLTVGAAAWAHHSFAMFGDKAITLTGTVQKLEWTNPHIWLWIVVDDGKGGTRTWGLEGPAPGQASRLGFAKRSVNPGDKIVVSTRPLKDGRPGGSLVSLARGDGTQLCCSLGSFEGSGGGPPPGPPGDAGSTPRTKLP